MENSINYAGIDISKLSLDVAIIKDGQHYHFKLSNDLNGFRSLLDILQAHYCTNITMEASGPYYLKVAYYLFEHNMKVSVVNPLVIRRFCQMRLSRTKTDKKDAKMIAEYGKREQPAVWIAPPAYAAELRQMLAAAEQLNKNRMNFVRQLEAFDQNPVICKDAITAINKVIWVIEEQIGRLEAKMQQLSEQYYGTVYQNLQTIPGLGKKTALLLTLLTDGFKRFSNARQVSAYFGLSPRTFESGTSVKGKSKITKMGMGRIRAILYVCAWSAKKCNQACKAQYERLVSAGKPKRVALIAVVNKLIKQAFAVATKSTAYQKNYQENICF